MPLGRTFSWVACQLASSPKAAPLLATWALPPGGFATTLPPPPSPLDLDPQVPPFHIFPFPSSQGTSFQIVGRSRFSSHSVEKP